MREELDQLLCQRYPLIFAERNLDMKETCMYWGFSCGDGWFDLIDALCERLQLWTDNNGAPQVVAQQVKQKFGGLCFYIGEASEQQHGMIRMAESMSLKLCEQCGCPGELYSRRGWRATYCSKHAPDGAVLASKNPNPWWSMSDV